MCKSPICNCIIFTFIYAIIKEPFLPLFWMVCLLWCLIQKYVSCIHIHSHTRICTNNKMEHSGRRKPYPLSADASWAHVFVPGWALCHLSDSFQVKVPMFFPNQTFAWKPSWDRSQSPSRAKASALMDFLGVPLTHSPVYSWPHSWHDGTEWVGPASLVIHLGTVSPAVLIPLTFLLLKQN